MKQSSFITLVALLPALTLAGCGAQPRKTEQAKPAATEKASDIYKKSDGVPAQDAMVTCPVSGHKVARSNAVMVKYDGKDIPLCCPDCVEPFKSNPAKYMAAYEKGEGVGEVPEGMK